MSKPPAHRICQVCRQLEPKSQLLRIVRTVDGQLLFDPDHRVSGRGYHFHPSCAAKALVSGKISHFLKVPNDQSLQKLVEEIKTKVTKQ